MEPLPAREQHQCCCIEVNPQGHGMDCSREVGPDAPFCPECEEHRSHPHKQPGWSFSQRLMVKERN